MKQVTPLPFCILCAPLFGLALMTTPPCGASQFVRGDVNQDGGRDLSDAISVVSYLFLGEATPACLDAADADDSGSLDITDAYSILSYLFLGGPPLAGPSVGCGDDPTADDPLDCRSFSRCDASRTVLLVGRTVDASRRPLAGVMVRAAGSEAVSAENGGFVLEGVPQSPAVHLAATGGGGMVGSKDVSTDTAASYVAVGDVVLTSDEEECRNVVARAAERGCGRVFAWGDEHVMFDSYLLFSEAFWGNAMDWLSEKTCEAGKRTRIGNQNGFHDGVKAFLESRGYTVIDLPAIGDLSQVDVLVVNAYGSGDAGAAPIKDWVEAGGALMTLVSGLGDHYADDCKGGNRFLAPLGLEYDCGHSAPSGPVTAFGDHPIVQGLGPKNAPFVNGRWVVDLPGFASEVVARVGENCSPSEVSPCGVPPGFNDGVPPEGNVDVLHDCSYDFNQDTDASTGVPELHIIGIYEAAMGRVTVNVNRTEPMVLVLSSYASVQWTVVPGAETSIQRVILTGYDSQFALVPGGIPVETHDIPSGNSLPMGYGNDCGGGDTPGLTAGAEALTGLTMKSFHGCYRAGEFTIVGPSPGPGPGLTVTGRAVDGQGEPLARVRVVTGWREGFSVSTGNFTLEQVTPASLLTVAASRGRFAGQKVVGHDPSSGLTQVDVGDIVLSPVDPPEDGASASCLNVVGRAAERGCGRIFVWGDEHVKFDSYLLFTEGFWQNSMDWLTEKTCEAGSRVRVASYNGFHQSVGAVLEARGLVVEEINSLDELDRFDVLVAQAHMRDVAGAERIKDWVEAGGALLTLVSGVGDGHQDDCFAGNELITALGLHYDCGHSAPWGPVTAFGTHAIAAGLEPRNAPFVNGRWVADLPGWTSSVVARSGDDCSPPEVPVIDCRVPPGFGDGTPPEGAVEVVGDCDALNEDTDASTGEPELHIIGIYEARAGRVAVNVNRTVPMVLVLSSYSTVQWTVTPAEGAVIEKVILLGYDEQLAVVPEGIPVESHSFGSGEYIPVGYGNDCGGGDTPGLISGAEGLSGLTLRSFHGCYQAGSFTFTR